VPLVGDTTPAAAALSYQVVASVPANGIGDGFTRLIVTDDDLLP
jgi:hypothetical protein